MRIILLCVAVWMIVFQLVICIRSSVVVGLVEAVALIQLFELEVIL